MNGFQVIGFGFLGALGTFGAIRLRRVPGQRLSSLAWVVTSIMGLLALAQPNKTSELARLVGIERGADLLSYLTALGLLGSTFFVHLRGRRFSAQITRLTRELALLRAEIAKPEPAAQPATLESRPNDPQLD